MSTQGTIKRYTLIIQKTSGPYHPTFKEILDHLEDQGFNISPRTLQRDIDQIRNEFQIEINYNRLRNTYSISEEDGMPTETLVRFLEVLGTAELFSESLKEGNDLLNFVSFEDQGNLKGIEFLKTIIAAVRNKRKIEVNHVNFESGKRTLYIISPYLLKEYQSRWYVFGTINNTNTFRTFGLDRIESLKIMKESFKPIKDLDPKSFFEDVVGLVYSDYDTEEVVLKVSAVQAKYLKALPLHKSQYVVSENETESHIRFIIKPNFEFMQRILMMAERATIIKPKWFADEIKQVLKQTLKNYIK
jgi:predicted DNA-binding transcriptional regulator YafY